MARFQSFLLIVSVVLVLVLVSVQGCDYGACRSDAIDNEDDFVRCDMCNCDGIDNLSGGSGTCTTSNDDLYNCYIKFDAEDLTWTCSLRMKIGYILMFVFISMFGCCACIYCCSLAEKQRRPPPTDTNNLNAYLIRRDDGPAQPVVVVQSSSYSKSAPVVVSTAVDSNKY